MFSIFKRRKIKIKRFVALLESSICHEELLSHSASTSARMQENFINALDKKPLYVKEVVSNNVYIVSVYYYE
jgi:hypothetical protein